MTIKTLAARVTNPYRNIHKPSLRIFLISDILLILLTAVLGYYAITSGTNNIPDFFNVGRDWSAAEIICYIKWAVMAAIFFLVRHHGGEAFFFWLGLVFLLILADDSLQLHERMNVLGPKLLGANTSLSYALGEIIFWVFWGALLLGLLLVVWKNTSKQTKDELWPLAILFAGVVFCGLGIDFLHFLAPEKSLAGGILLLAEDGGEMIFISLMMSYVIGVFGNYAK